MPNRLGKCRRSVAMACCLQEVQFPSVAFCRPLMDVGCQKKLELGLNLSVIFTCDIDQLGPAVTFLRSPFPNGYVVLPNLQPAISAVVEE